MRESTGSNPLIYPLIYEFANMLCDKNPHCMSHHIDSSVLFSLLSTVHQDISKRSEKLGNILKDCCKSRKKLGGKRPIRVSETEEDLNAI